MRGGALFVELVDVPEECLVAEGGATWQNSYRCGGVCNILIGDAYMHLSQCLFNHQAASQQTTIAMTASESPSAEHKVNVLFVCLGNICRSTMAEGVFRNMASTHPLINEIDSAGTGAYHTLEPPDSRTMSTLRRHGITNYNHAARKITKDDFLHFDYLLAMDKYNLRDLLDVRESVVASLRKSGGAKGPRASSGGAGAKVAEVRLFGDFGPGGVLHDRVGGGEVVQDPYYGGVNGFEEVYQQVVRFSKSFLEYLEKKQGSEVEE